MAVDSPKPSALRTWWAGMSKGWRRLIEFCGGLAVLVGLFLALQQVLDTIRQDPPPPTGTIEVRGGWVPNMSLADFRAQHPEWSAAGDSALLGAVFTLGVQLDNLKGKTVLLTWRLTDADSKQPIGAQAGERRELSLRPPRSSWTDELEAWVPYPATRHFFVKFSIEHDEETLASDDSDPIELGNWSSP